MSNLTYSQSESGLEVVILKTGDAFCTQSSYSRWVNVDRTTIVKRCSNLETLELATLDEPVKKSTGLIKTVIDAGLTGDKEVVLIPAKIMARWLAKDKPELFDAIVDAGATQFLYKMAGYQIKVDQPQPVESSFKILRPESFEQCQNHLQFLQSQYDYWKGENNFRMMAHWESKLIQSSDAYLLPSSTSEPHNAIKYQTVIDVAIQLGLKCPSRFESALGNYVGKRLAHLKVVDDSGQNLKDSRNSQASNKQINAQLYPANNPEVIEVVKDYFVMMDERQWMTAKELKSLR